MLGQTYYIAVKYKEIETRPVRAHPVGCSCDQVHCESSRILDSFMVKALTELPQSHIGDPPEIEAVIYGERNCSPCPMEPWVVLAKVTPDNSGEISQCDIDNCSFRRWVLSFANFWWRCTEKPKMETINPNSGEKGPQPIDVTITGCNYVSEGDQKTQVNFGENIVLNVSSISTTTIAVELDLQNAEVGFKDVTVTNPDGQSATLIKGFEVRKTSVLVKNPLVKKIKLPKKLQPGKEIKFEVIGSNFKSGLKANFGKGKKDMISIRKIEFIDPQKAKITAYIWTNAKPGIRELIITNPDGKSASLSKNFKIK
jgi:hypothetical protein